MPYLSITTNTILGEDTRARLLHQTSARVAALLAKSENYVMVSLHHSPSMLFGGSSDPLAYLELKSIALPEERSGEMSAALCELVLEVTGIPKERVYIEFSNAARHLWGWNAKTF
ncbi:MAG: phenylpyruvate tautomerase MIF-related protein [Pseudomonadota bacterium]